jgi:hypothetical protein
MGVVDCGVRCGPEGDHRSIAHGCFRSVKRFIDIKAGQQVIGRYPTPRHWPTVRFNDALPQSKRCEDGIIELCRPFDVVGSERDMAEHLLMTIVFCRLRRLSPLFVVDINPYCDGAMVRGKKADLDCEITKVSKVLHTCHSCGQPSGLQLGKRFASVGQHGIGNCELLPALDSHIIVRS